MGKVFWGPCRRPPFDIRVVSLNNQRRTDVTRHQGVGVYGCDPRASCTADLVEELVELICCGLYVFERRLRCDLLLQLKHEVFDLLLICVRSDVAPRSTCLVPVRLNLLYEENLVAVDIVAGRHTCVCQYVLMT